MRGGRGGDWETTVKRSILTPEVLRRLIDRYDRLDAEQPQPARY